jgi:hypothetical protein
MWWFAALVHPCKEMKPAMPGLMKDCAMKLRWTDWYFAKLVLVQEPASCRHSLVVGQSLELKLMGGTRTAAVAVREVWAWEGPRTLGMDQVLQCMAVLLMAKRANALRLSLLDWCPSQN